VTKIRNLLHGTGDQATDEKIPKMKSVMTEFPHDIESHAPIGQARKRMMAYKVRHFPVTENHVLKGLITDRDIKLILAPEFDYLDPKSLTVEDAMVADPYSVDLETSLIVTLDEMAARHIGAALVMKGDRVAGIFSASDACRVVVILFSPLLHSQLN
jgi:CBS domain-containing protein